VRRGKTTRIQQAGNSNIKMARPNDRSGSARSAQDEPAACATPRIARRCGTAGGLDQGVVLDVLGSDHAAAHAREEKAKDLSGEPVRSMTGVRRCSASLLDHPSMTAS